MEKIIRSIKLRNTTYKNKSYIISANLNNVSWVNNDMTNAFYNCQSLTQVSGINSLVNNMSYAFYNCILLNDTITLPNNIVNVKGTFYNCFSLNNTITLPNSIVDVEATFYDCHNLSYTPIFSDPSNINIMTLTFWNCCNLSTFDFSNFSNLKSIDITFESCNILTSIENLDKCEKLEKIQGGFSLCKSLTTPPTLPNSIKHLESAFSGCVSLTDAPIMNNIDNECNMYGTFSGCNTLLNVSSLPNKVTNMHRTFANCKLLQNIPGIPNSVTNMCNTFYNCNNLTGDIYIHSENVVDARNCFYSTSLQKNVYIPFKYNVLEDMYAWYKESPASGYPSSLYTKTETPLSNTEGQIFYENGIPFTESEIITTESNSYINFGTDQTNYSRYSEYDIIDDGNTKTYNSFNQYYGNGENGVLLKDINEL